MKTFLNIIFFFLIGIIPLNAQSTIQELVEKGIKYHDNGNFAEAVKAYQKALEIDSESPLANYELANTYCSMGEYKKTIKYAERVLKSKSDLDDMAYILKGTALDELGKPNEAIETYKEGIKSSPQNNMLHFNLAITYAKQNKLDLAITSLISALNIEPNHPSSNYVLGVINAQDKDNRVKTLLASYYFLLIEPNTNRSKDVLTLIDTQLGQNITKKSDTEMTLNISPLDTNVEFSRANMILTLVAAAQSTKENKDKSKVEIRRNIATQFVSIMAEEEQKDNAGFWKEHYVTFFIALKEAGHLEAFTYYIQASLPDQEVQNWLKTNADKVAELEKWQEAYTFSN